jgi:hypothetical protein
MIEADVQVAGSEGLFLELYQPICRKESHRMFALRIGSELALSATSGL